MSLLLQLLRFIPLMTIKCFRNTLYKLELNLVGSASEKDWQETRLVVVLNHTSLAEFLYGMALPTKFLWRLAGNLSFPVAEETLKKPLFRYVFKALAPNVVSLSRRRDNTWKQFKDGIGKDSMVIILPEGRMMRKNGLDKHGKPMSVKKGIAEIIPRFKGEKILIAYGGGLAHVLAPGSFVPKIFKKIQLNIEFVDADIYMEQLNKKDDQNFADALKEDLEQRLRRHKPSLTRIRNEAKSSS